VASGTVGRKLPIGYHSITVALLALAGLIAADLIGKSGDRARAVFLVALLGSVAILIVQPLIEKLQDAARLSLHPDDIVRDPREVLRAIASELRGAVEGDAAEVPFRDRHASVRVVREGVTGLRYEIRLTTALGAPRFGRLEGLEGVARFQTVEGPFAPLAKSLRENEHQWFALFRIYHVAFVEFGDGFVRASASWGGGVLPAPEEAGRILRLLERLHVVSLGQTALAVRERAGAAERCPYCHDGFRADDEATQDCVGCGTRHHVACFEELGGCALLGCRARARKPVARTF
jgi:hypothetical protein